MPSRLTKERSRWSTLSYRLALLIFVLLGVSAVVTTTFAVRSAQSAMYLQNNQSMDNVHASVSSLISVGYQSVVDYRKAALAARKAKLQDVSAPIITALDTLRSAADAGQMSTADAKADALRMLKGVRYANKDYFFTYDRTMTAISHPDAKFEGKNLIDMQDADGRYVLRIARDIALNQGSGFFDYKWVRLNQDLALPKIGYVFHYQPWDWIIGTGVYVDDIDAEASARLEEMKITLAQAFAKVNFSKDSTFFVLNRKGEVVVAPEASDLGTLADTPQGQSLAQTLIAAAPLSGTANVEITVDAALRDGVTEPWVMNVSTFGPLDWILVSAVPKAELSAAGQSLAIQQALLSIVVLIIGLVGGLLLSRRIVRPVETITKAARALSDDTFDPHSLDSAAARKDEVGELARTFQRMGREIVERERRLREQVAKLTVVIDRSKVEIDVGAITETDYFQRIKARADEYRALRKAEDQQ